MTIPTDRPGTALLIVDVQVGVMEPSIRRNEVVANRLNKACMWLRMCIGVFTILELACGWIGINMTLWPAMNAVCP